MTRIFSLALALLAVPVWASGQTPVPPAPDVEREAAPRVEAATPAARAQGVAPAKAQEVAAPAVRSTDEPPPSKWDLERQRESGEIGRPPEGPSLTWQLVRTILALMAVVGLIYLVFKVGLAKYLGAATTKRGGKSMSLIERLALDPRHSVYLVKVDEDRYLLGAGERGVRLLARLDGRQSSPQRTSEFRSSLESAALVDAKARQGQHEDADGHD